MEIFAAAALAPEKALISAVPDWVPAISRTVALPPVVRPSAGSILPSDVVNVTTVPFCTGVPPLSSTLAVTSADPPSGSNCVLVNSVMVVPVGARSGTLSHAPISASGASRMTTAMHRAGPRRAAWRSRERRCSGIMEVA